MPRTSPQIHRAMTIPPSCGPPLGCRSASGATAASRPSAVTSGTRANLVAHPSGRSSMTRARAAVLIVAALTLAACGNIHPGAAAVVDDQTISMRTLNKTARAYCTLSLAGSQQQGATSPDNAEVRRQAVTTLVSLAVGRKLAKEHGITVRPSQY